MKPSPPQARRTRPRAAFYKLAVLAGCAAAGFVFLRANRPKPHHLPPSVPPVAPPRPHRPATSTVRGEALTYVVGYGSALLLTGAAFGLVYFHRLAGRQAFYAVLGLGLAQMVVHFRGFLHIGLKRSARADLQLILFSALIAALMVGGTVVILFNLQQRMM